MANYSQIAKAARLKVLDMIYQAQTSHIGSNLSVIDILAVLYERANLNLQDWENRDRIILSKGWAAASLYYFLYTKGIITKEDLDSYCRPGSRFIGLAEPVARGIEFAGGSMGHGLPAGVGMALAAKRQGKNYKVYVVMSDGEMDCGTTWESALIAAHHKLDNLVVIVDCNGWQAMGKTIDILDQGALFSKWEAFGWDIDDLNGHNYEDIEDSLGFEDQMSRGKPVVILAHTLKGKGVSFMEDKLEWHYKNIDDESYQKALNELS